MATDTAYKTDVEAVNGLAKAYTDLKSEIAKVIIGQDDVVKAVIISLLTSDSFIYRK